MVNNNNHMNTGNQKEPKRNEFFLVCFIRLCAGTSSE
jgi:hypothetical protein